MKKVAHYRRSFWMDGVNNRLSEVIEDCFQNTEEGDLPIFEISDGMNCMIARRSIFNEARFIHFVCYEEGAPVAIINTQVHAAAVDADEQDPDGENEYIQSQLFCLLAGDHIIWATHNSALREGKIRDIIASFISSKGGDDESTMFGFQVILDQVVVQQAFEDGIQEIDLGIGAFAPTLDRVSNGGIIPELGIWQNLKGLLIEPATAEQLEAANDVEAKLILRPGKDWKKPEVKSLMSTISNNICNSYDDEFAIVTKSGLRLTRDKVSLRA